MDPFNDGTYNNYAFGVSIGEHLGRKRIGHGGSIGGFRSQIGTYPEEKLNIVVLTNFAQGNPGGKASEIAAILLKDKAKKEEPEPFKGKKLSEKELESYEGHFWNDRSKLSRKLYVRNDTLRYARSQFNESPLVPMGDDVFRMAGVGINVRLRFDMESNPRVISFQEGNGSPMIMTEYEQVAETPSELAEYVGTYYSPEIETAYRIVVEGEKVKGYHTRHGWFVLQRQAKDVLTGSWPLNVIEIQRDDSGQVDGLLVTNGRVRNMRFDRR